MSVKLKICGVKSIREARLLRNSGVDLVGLNFIPSSSRFISLEVAQAVMAELRGGPQTVALFASRPLDEVNDYVMRLGVDYVQLHGNEPADYAQGIRAKVIRAVPIRTDQSVADLIAFIKSYPADFLVLDRPRQGQGDIIDLGLAAEVCSALPSKIFLAGGLNPDNLKAVLAQVQPYGIDIAGGVRDSHDDLDIARVHRCADILRLAD